MRIDFDVRDAFVPRAPGAARATGAALIAALPLWLAGCSLAPRDAPTSSAIRGQATETVAQGDEHVAFALVPLRESELAAINASHAGDPSELGALARVGGAARESPLGVGDTVSVSIFESAPGGLFVPAEAGTRTGNFVQVPNLQVDTSGTIDVPYAGNVPVSGLTPRLAADAISKRLAHRAIEPQTVVTLIDRRANQISVLGDVSQPARVPIDPGGVRILDAITRAGGNKDPDYETEITVQRHGRKYRAMLSSLVADPTQNILLAAGDVVYLAHNPRYFMVFGATGEVNTTITRRVTFEADTMTLAEGLAKAGGLRDDRTDASAVFVFRMEPAALLRTLGVDVTKFPSAIVPTVYSVDLNTPDGVFMMSHLRLANRDVVVASDAATVEFLKYVNVATQLSITPYNVSGAYSFARVPR
jgi:polysaccharide export outer membrane protein